MTTMMAQPPQQLQSTVDSSHNTSVASLVSGAAGVTAYAAPLVSPVPSPVPIQQSYELIPHRVFVGGFPTTTTEAELRTFFEQYGHIREAKVIRSVDGVSKGYGFVTFDNETEAATVRKIPGEQLEFKGRRLNLGPAMRRVTHANRFSEFAVATPGAQLVTYQQPSPPYAATFPCYQYQTASPTYGYTATGATTPGYILLQNGALAQTPSFVYSPVTPNAPNPLAAAAAAAAHANYGQHHSVVDNRQVSYAHQQQLMQPPIKTSSQITLADQSVDGTEQELEATAAALGGVKLSGQGTPNHPTQQQPQHGAVFRHESHTPLSRRHGAPPRPQRLYQNQSYANGSEAAPQQQQQPTTTAAVGYGAYATASGDAHVHMPPPHVHHYAQQVNAAHNYHHQ